MAEYQYPLSSVISGNFLADQCQYLINNDVDIFQTCIGINTDETTIYVFFDAPLSAPEEAELESIIINFDTWPEELNSIVKYVKTLTIGTTQTPLGSGWTKILGFLEGFDIDTGIFTAVDNGSYSYVLSANFSSFGTNTHTTLLSLQPETTGNSYPLIGTAGYMTYANGTFLFSGNQLEHTLLMNTEASDAELIFKIRKL